MDKREIDTLYSVPPALVDGKFTLYISSELILKDTISNADSKSNMPYLRQTCQSQYRIFLGFFGLSLYLDIFRHFWIVLDN